MTFSFCLLKTIAAAFLHLWLCLEDHKRIRTQVFTRSAFEQPGNQELVLFVEPFRSPYEFQMLGSMDFDMTNIMKTKKKYFAGRNDNRNNTMQVSLHDMKNRRISNMQCARLTCSY